MTEQQQLAFEREARETILRLALEEVLNLYSETLGEQAADALFRLEHGFVSSIRDAPTPEHLATPTCAAIHDAVALIRQAFDGAHRRLGDMSEQAPLEPQAA